MRNKEIAVVHKFEVWDDLRGVTIVQPSKRTAESIEQIGGRIIPGTAETIDATLLDGCGRYFPANMSSFMKREPEPAT